MSAIRSTKAPRGDAAKDAERILAEVWGDVIPVDPALVARRLGIDVLNARLNETVSGALVKEPGHDPSIVLNSMDSASRRRFSCAHEIGHFVRRRDALDAYEYVDYRDTLSSGGLDAEEEDVRIVVELRRRSQVDDQTVTGSATS